MSEIVLDASAVLAILFQEKGWETLTAELLADSVIGTVNLAEVQCKLIKKGYSPEEAWEDALSVIAIAAPFTSGQAKIAGDLIAETRKFGLSLGDRCCLALAIALKAPVYTTEQMWRNLKIGVPIHVIRSI
jgi:PIN domain nuclease of toxin-antitoxin system